MCRDQLADKKVELLRNETHFKIELDTVKRNYENKLSTYVAKIDQIQFNYDSDLKDKLFKYNKLREDKLSMEKNLLTQVSQLKNELENYKENQFNQSKMSIDEEQQQNLLIKKLKQNEKEMMERLREKDTMYSELKSN